ncbi:MAG: LuxR C-terminal-related transcriptional regulator [Prevotella sp.]|nr:LuxR C-terminal-related transcriptional regulator [Prevotella sp.]
MKINPQLNNTLTLQARTGSSLPDRAALAATAAAYAEVENAIAVLSDMKRQESEIFYGKAGDLLGIAPHGAHHSIPSIWEEEIMCRIHPDDLVAKQADELKFYYFLTNISPENVTDYIYRSTLRMRDARGVYHPMTHSISYLQVDEKHHMRFALCIYTLCRDNAHNKIINTATGEELKLRKADYADILSKREKEILRGIDQGLSSKMIADHLNISFNTVSRHRANIREKLHAANTAEAVSIARRLGLIGV